MIAVKIHTHTGTRPVPTLANPNATVWPNSHGTAILITLRVRLCRPEGAASVLSSRTLSRNSRLPGVAPRGRLSHQDAHPVAGTITRAKASTLTTKELIDTPL